MALQGAERLEEVSPRAQLEDDVGLLACDGANRMGRRVTLSPHIDA